MGSILRSAGLGSRGPWERLLVVQGLLLYTKILSLSTEEIRKIMYIPRVHLVHNSPNTIWNPPLPSAFICSVEDIIFSEELTLLHGAPSQKIT